ncbi:MAG: hypothetical protein QGH23_03525 [Dehalococcoidia bacterium]|nr:hypothetical protein [Dehalococcoidia bacterium]MDP6782218.1 hypothetical protein [Dehalococcoidia bacterium]
MKGRQQRILGVSGNVFFLGLVSLFTDISSDMISTLLPLFLFSVLGTPVAIIGLIEGVGDATATSFRLVSGWLSDRMGRRKGLAAVGYSLSTVAKPFCTWPVVGGRYSECVSRTAWARPSVPRPGMHCWPIPQRRESGAGALAFTGAWTAWVPWWGWGWRPWWCTSPSRGR